MSLLAAHINDAGITVLGERGIVYREPGFALLDDRELVTGDRAFANARLKPRCIHKHYWSSLSSEPLSDARFKHLTAADLVSLQLESIWSLASPHGDRLIVAVPPSMNAEQLGLFLGIADALGIPIVAMVDAAVSATRREYPGVTLVHVDFGLQAAWLTRLAQNEQVQVERSAVVEAVGTVVLTDAWIKSIAAAFVKQSRFDPLHTAATEQLMQDRLPQWLSRLGAQDGIEVAMTYRGTEYRAELDRLDVVGAVEPLYQRLLAQLRALLRADEHPAIQLSDRAARLPGLADALSARVGGDLFMLEAGASARGLLARCAGMQRSTGNVTLLKQLHWDRSPAEIRRSAAGGDGVRPSHLLFGARAWPIDQRLLVLGAQPAEGERCIDLPADMPGVSRRHCALRQQGGQCIVEDYSRYGTYLNGHRIEGSAVLQAGDQLRIGTPGHEFKLILTESAHGA